VARHVGSSEERFFVDMLDVKFNRCFSVGRSRDKRDSAVVHGTGRNLAEYWPRG
jgi:hypothetical protein